MNCYYLTVQVIELPAFKEGGMNSNLLRQRNLFKKYSSSKKYIGETQIQPTATRVIIDSASLIGQMNHKNLSDNPD